MRFTPNLLRIPKSGLASFVKIPGADARPNWSFRNWSPWKPLKFWSFMMIGTVRCASLRSIFHVQQSLSIRS